MIPTNGNAEDPEQPIPQRLLYPVPEAAAQLGGITERMLWTLIARGDIETVRVGRRRMVPAAALDAYISNLRIKAAA